MSSHTKQMVDCLKSLQATSPNIEASSVVNVNGQIMASTFPTDIDQAQVLNISATLLSTIEHLMNEMKSGKLKRVTIEGSNKLIVMVAVGENAVLAVLAHNEANLGQIFDTMNLTIDNLVKLL